MINLLKGHNNPSNSFWTFDSHDTMSALYIYLSDGNEARKIVEHTLNIFTDYSISCRDTLSDVAAFLAYWSLDNNDTSISGKQISNVGKLVCNIHHYNKFLQRRLQKIKMSEIYLVLLSI